jgi:hypothetical protein
MHVYGKEFAKDVQGLQKTLEDKNYKIVEDFDSLLE